MSRSGERSVRIREVEGSNPFGSTKNRQAPSGACRFYLLSRETTGSAGGGAPQKALASSIERSELLTVGYQKRKTAVRTEIARLRAVGQVMRAK